MVAEKVNGERETAKEMVNHDKLMAEAKATKEHKAVEKEIVKEKVKHEAPLLHRHH